MLTYFPQVSFISSTVVVAVAVDAAERVLGALLDEVILSKVTATASVSVNNKQRTIRKQCVQYVHFQFR